MRDLSGSGLTDFSILTGATLGSPHKIATAIRSDGMSTYVDGSLLDSRAVDFTAACGSGLVDRLAINSLATTVNGLIREIRYYDEGFQDSVVQDMSNGNFPAEGHSGIGLGFGKMGAQGAQ
jgi:hypothetical protein